MNWSVFMFILDVISCYSCLIVMYLIVYFGPMGPWWRHQMETFSALLALCAGNSPVTGEFPTQRPVTRSFDVFFDLRVNKRLNKQSRGWWFETPSRSLWRHCNDNRILLHVLVWIYRFTFHVTCFQEKQTQYIITFTIFMGTKYTTNIHYLLSWEANFWLICINQLSHDICCGSLQVMYAWAKIPFSLPELYSFMRFKIE